MVSSLDKDSWVNRVKGSSLDGSLREAEVLTPETRELFEKKKIFYEKVAALYDAVKNNRGEDAVGEAQNELSEMLLSHLPQLSRHATDVLAKSLLPESPKELARLDLNLFSSFKWGEISRLRVVSQNLRSLIADTTIGGPPPVVLQVIEVLRDFGIGNNLATIIVTEINEEVSGARGMRQ